jgi:hypothetical protein
MICDFRKIYAKLMKKFCISKNYHMTNIRFSKMKYFDNYLINSVYKWEKSCIFARSKMQQHKYIHNLN